MQSLENVIFSHNEVFSVFNVGAYWKSIATVWEDVDHSVYNI